MKLGRAAKATIIRLVYDVHISNQKLSSDNVALFDKTKHANVARKSRYGCLVTDKSAPANAGYTKGRSYLGICTGADGVEVCSKSGD